VQGGAGPSAAEVAARVGYHQSTSVLETPPVLGNPPGSPPPEWLPAPAARMARALGAHIGAMFNEREVTKDDALTSERERAEPMVRGLSASAGR